MSVPFLKEQLTPRVKKWVKKYVRFSARDDARQKAACLRVGERKNCVIENGVLRAGLGLKPFTLENGIAVANVAQGATPQTFFWFLDDAKAQHLACLTKTGTFYIYGVNGWMLRAQFSTPMHTFLTRSDTEDVVVFVGGAGYATYSGESGDLTFHSRDAFLSVGCSAQGRVFCVNAENEIVYFAAFDHSNTTADGENVGKIRLPKWAGEIVAMVDLGDCIAVFCAYGIFTIQVRGNGDDFIVKKVLFDGGQIFGDSVCVMKEQGDKVAFLTECGVYLLHGASVKKLDLDIEILPKRQGQVCDQAVADGKYVLMYVDLSGETKCVVIDVENESGYACFTADGFCDVNGYAACVQRTNVQLFSKDGDFPAGETAQVQFDSDGDTTGKKTLKAITLFGKGEAAVRVESENGAQAFAIDLSAGKATAKVNAQGETFTVVCSMPSGSEISGCRMEFCKLLEVVK